MRYDKVIRKAERLAHKHDAAKLIMERAYQFQNAASDDILARIKAITG